MRIADAIIPFLATSICATAMAAAVPYALSTPIPDPARAAIVPTPVKVILYRKPPDQLGRAPATENNTSQGNVPALETPQPVSLPAGPEGVPGLSETPGWPRVLPGQNGSPPAPEAWAAATEIDLYLCEVYHRVPVKADRSGDFSWKDRTAAKRAGKGLCEYSIGGMNQEFRELLYAMGLKLDAAGLRWSILSGFRDDYRQGIASGFKARGGNSLHGGSRATGGYGDGRAIDITVEPNSQLSKVFQIVDTFGKAIGLHRPMPKADAAHIQVFGSWKASAAKLRSARKQHIARAR